MSVGLSVCLSVISISKNISDGFVPHFMGRLPNGKDKTNLVSIRWVDGCGSNGPEICQM